MFLYLPYNIKFILIKNFLKKRDYILLYNKYKYLYLLYNTIDYNKSTNFLVINNKNNNTLVSYVKSWSLFFIKKIKFKGKGYKITKKKNFLILNFNNSHLTWLLLFNIKCIKKSKLKYLFIYSNMLKLLSLIKLILNIRFINIYTKRGINLSKQIIYKKIGKRT